MGLVAGASHAQTARWPGVKWAKPAGMVETDTWSRDCPSDCIMYEGPDDDEWPLIVVHAPIVGAVATAPEAWRTGLAKRTEETVERLGEQKTTHAGDVQLVMAMYEQRTSYDDPGDGTFSVVGFASKGNVSVPVELKSLNKRDLEGRIKVLSTAIGSVAIDPVIAASGKQAFDNDLKTKAAAIAAGYARGEQAEMFLNVEAGVRNEFRVGGLQLIAYREENRLLFLPGGVFIDSHDDVKDYRTPDLAWLKGQKLLGTWTKACDTYRVVKADGAIETYRPGKKDGAQPSLTMDGDRTYWQIAHISAADLVGTYASIDTSTSGGGSSNLAMVASRSDKKLRLLPGGQFQMSRDGWVGVVGGNVTISGNGTNAVSGKYEYDPKSWMLTLRGDDGKVTRGPMVPSPASSRLPHAPAVATGTCSATRNGGARSDHNCRSRVTCTPYRLAIRERLQFQPRCLLVRRFACG